MGMKISLKNQEVRKSRANFSQRFRWGSKKLLGKIFGSKNRNSLYCTWITQCSGFKHSCRYVVQFLCKTCVARQVILVMQCGFLAKLVALLNRVHCVWNSLFRCFAFAFWDSFIKSETAFLVDYEQLLFFTYSVKWKKAREKNGLANFSFSVKKKRGVARSLSSQELAKSKLNTVKPV
jgi:hypothetical protein